MLSPSPSRSPNPRAHHTLPHLHLHQSNTRPPSASSPYPPGRNKQMYATAASRAPAMQYSSLGDALGGSAAAAAVASRHPQSSTSFAAPAVSPISGAGPEATYSPVAAAGVSGDGRSYSAYPPSSSYDYHHHQHQHPYQSSSAASAPASATSPYEPHASSSSSTYVSHSNTSATQTSSLPPMRTASPISHTSIHVSHQQPQYSNSSYMSSYQQNQYPWTSDEPHPSSWSQQQQQTQQQGYSASAESGPFAAANRPSSDITTSPHQEQRPYVIGTGSTPHQQQYSPRASYPSIHSPTGPARGKGREYGAHGAEAAPPFRSPSNTTTTVNSGSFIPSLSDLSKVRGSLIPNIWFMLTDFETYLPLFLIYLIYLIFPSGPTDVSYISATLRRLPLYLPTTATSPIATARVRGEAGISR